MLKALVLASALSLSASVSFAGQFENFKACAANDSSWMSRWGNYVVAFDRTRATSECQRTTFPGSSFTVKQAGCNLSGGWVNAGYYCDENSFGG